MKIGKKLMKDLMKAFLLGVGMAGGFGMIFFLGGFLSSGFQIVQALEAAKNGLLFVAAIGIFLIAGMLLVKGKSPEKFRQKESWRKQFQILGYKSVIGMACAVVIVVAACLDYILLMQK